MTIFRTLYSKRESFAVDLSSEDQVSQQQFKDYCDVNSILKKYFQTGQIENCQRLKPVFDDFSNLDYKTSLDKVRKAEDAFLSLPSYVRKKCGNTPDGFLDWMSKDVDVEEKIKFGLVDKPIPKKVVTDDNSRSAEPSNA